MPDYLRSYLNSPGGQFPGHDQFQTKTIALKWRGCGSICHETVIFLWFPLAMTLLYPALLRRRYKRFLADVTLPDGCEITVHCPNTGSMKNCVLPDSPCWYSVSESKTRKYAQTLEVVSTPGNYLAGINTGRANTLVEEALIAGTVRELQGYRTLKREQVYGQEKSRIDFLLSDNLLDRRTCYVEIKNVTLMETDGEGYFPDAVSTRGSKHLRELMMMVQLGHRAVLLFCVQHNGIKTVRPADHIDAVYGKSLREASAAGVELLAYAADFSALKHSVLLSGPVQNCISLYQSLPVEL